MRLIPLLAGLFVSAASNAGVFVSNAYLTAGIYRSDDGFIQPQQVANIIRPDIDPTFVVNFLTDDAKRYSVQVIMLDEHGGELDRTEIKQLDGDEFASWTIKLSNKFIHRPAFQHVLVLDVTNGLRPRKLAESVFRMAY